MANKHLTEDMRRVARHLCLESLMSVSAARDLLPEAADEIDRLRARVAELEEFLKWVRDRLKEVVLSEADATEDRS